MKITKRQLKKIIREEYSTLKRQGLITETSNLPGDHKGIGKGAIERTSHRIRRKEQDLQSIYGVTKSSAIRNGYSAGKRGLPREVPPVFRHYARDWENGYDDATLEESLNYRAKQKRVLKEGGVKNLLIEIEEVLFAALGSKPSGKMNMEYAIDLIMLNFPEVFANTSPMKIEEFISDYNDVYHDIYIDPMSRTITYKG